MYYAFKFSLTSLPLFWSFQHWRTGFGWGFFFHTCHVSKLLSPSAPSLRYMRQKENPVNSTPCHSLPLKIADSQNPKPHGIAGELPWGREWTRRGRLCGSQAVEWSLIPGGQWDWLVWIILQAGGEWNPLGWGPGGKQLVRPSQNELGGEPRCCWAQESSWRGLWRPCRFPMLKQIILILQFGIYATIMSRVSGCISREDKGKEHLLHLPGNWSGLIITRAFANDSSPSVQVHTELSPARKRCSPHIHSSLLFSRAQ